MRTYTPDAVDAARRVLADDEIASEASKAQARKVLAQADAEQVDEEQRECPGHPCEDAADRFPHAGIGETFYCDGSCIS